MNRFNQISKEYIWFNKHQMKSDNENNNKLLIYLLYISGFYNRTKKNISKDKYNAQ